MVSILSPISYSFSTFFLVFDDCFKRTNFFWSHPHLSQLFFFFFFFNSMARSKYSWIFLLFSLCDPPEQLSPLIDLLLSINTCSDILTSIRWFVSESSWRLYVSQFRGFRFMHLLFSSLVKFESLNRSSQWITFFRHSCLVLYSFPASLIYSLFVWLIISSLLLHNPCFYSVEY